MQDSIRAAFGSGKAGLALFASLLLALVFGASSAYAANVVSPSMVQGTSDVVYTGVEQDPVTLGGGLSQLTKYNPHGLYIEQHKYDYKVEYQGDHTNAGTVHYTVTGGADCGSQQRDYEGSFSGTFEIHQADLSKAKVSFPSDVNNRYIQTGEAIKPKPQVSMDGTNYLPESDYDVAYVDRTGVEVADPVEPGWYRVKITAKSGNVTGQNTELRFQIAKSALSFDDQGVEIGDIADQTYKGEAIEPDLTVTTVAGTKLRKGLDYTVSYKDNVNVGTATATITGTGVYEGTRTATFKINQLQLSQYDSSENQSGIVWMSGLANSQTMPYTGSPIKPDIHVVGYKGAWNVYGNYADPDGPVLKEGVDYTVEYVNTTDIWMDDNVKNGFSAYKNKRFDAAKQPTVIVTGKGNTQGAVKFTFCITPAADLGNAVLRSAPTVTFDGAAHALKPSDFESSFINLSQEANAFAYGLGDKEGIAYDVSYKDADGKAINAKDVVNAGKYTLVLTGKPSGGFTGTKEVGFAIKQASFDDVKIADVNANGHYAKALPLTDGKAEPDFDLTLGEGDGAYHLKRGIDYTVAYTGNTEAGKPARATITPKGNFIGGIKAVTFSIRSADQDQAVAALNDAVAQAQKLTQGKKSADAYAALAAAIQKAAVVAASSDDVSALTAAKNDLNAAVKAFNASADVVAPKPDKKPTNAGKAAKDKPAKAKDAAAKKAAAAKAKAKKQATITVNAKKVTASAVAKAVKKAGSSKAKVETIVLGSKAKSVSKKAFAKYAKAKTLVVKSKKLTKKSVKGSLKGSKVTTVKVQVAKKAKTNKTYAKKYQKIFTKANAGKKVAVKAA